jgi:hypothetical protein
LRAVTVVALSTGCRAGELLGFSGGDVRFDEHGKARWIVLPGARTETYQTRRIPVGTRLQPELEMRRHDPSTESGITNPNEGWGAFVSGGQPDWSSIVATGHSLAEGEAALTASKYQVARGDVLLAKRPQGRRLNYAVLSGAG